MQAYAKILENDVKKFYNENHRKYHTFDHISTMLSDAKIHNINLTLSQYIAILYHDIIYIPCWKNNEILSASLMVNRIKSLNLNISDDVLLEAKRIILDTNNHIPTTDLSKIVIDLDLFGFAKSYDLVKIYNKQIEDEFSFLPKEKVVDGRIRFLRIMNARQIFCSNLFIYRYEEDAHLNIRKSIKELEERQ